MDDSEKLNMQSPLVLWVETFKANDGHPLEYQDLFDGVFLNDVMQQIDTRSAYDNVNRCVEDVSVRLHNWDILMKNIRGYYSDVLQQLLVMRLPNISAICREPEKDSSFAEIRKALLLILGCAVQCEQKETFIDKIMTMDISAQAEIVENIKEITDDCETILPIPRPESPASSSSYVDKMFHHLCRLIRERDECVQLAADMGQAKCGHMVDVPQMSPDRHHTALELAECKAKLRHVQQELEDRQEQLSDVKDELQECLTICAQLKNENALLVQEARASRSLQDELDILKEKASKVDMFEKEILKYKEKLNEFEFYKARTAELKEDNAILEETKAMLEDQLTNSRKRIETVEDLESELERYRQHLGELSRDRESDRERIDYLTEENARLEFERKSSRNESVSLETELSTARSRVENIGSSLSEQLSETSHTRILRLELENQRLSVRLAEIKKTDVIQNAEKGIELQKENEKLLKKIEKLQCSACESSDQVIQMENKLSSMTEERDKLLKAVDSVNEKADQHVKELERDIEQLSQTLNQMRERTEKMSDSKMKDVERENKRLHETLAAKMSELNKLEFEHRQLQRSSHQLKENAQRLLEIEQENHLLDKENAELHKKLATLQHTADKLHAIEQENSDLSVENHKLQKMVETLNITAQRKEEIEQDLVSLTIEHQHLQKRLEALKTGSDRALELETEKEELIKEIQQIRKQMEGQKTQKLKQEQMEFEVIDLGNENQRLQKSLEVTTRRLHQLEKDNIDIETDNEQISKELETLRVTVKQLEDKSREVVQLEAELQQLQKDKTTLEKENRKLKQSSDIKDKSMEDISAKFLSLNQEYKSLRQSVEKMKETSNKAKDLEEENRGLVQELNTERRALVALKEELMNEKTHFQELKRKVDYLTSELEKIGIDTEKLTIAEQVKDVSHYKTLEAMAEKILTKDSDFKNETIWGLETRLDESKSMNFRLQEELRAAEIGSEVLKQRLEEKEVLMHGVEKSSKIESEKYIKLASSNATKEILQLKDHLVELERQNATLLAETDNLRSNNQNITKQCRKLDSQLSNLQSQNATLQSHYSSVQEQNAKLQVDYISLQSKTSSALSQRDMLKNQLSHLEAEHEILTHKHDGLQNSYQSLHSDHESLQCKHQQVTAEYESLIGEHNALKSLHKSLKVELKDLQNQFDLLHKGKDDVSKLRDVMKKEREQLQKEVTLLGNMQTDYQHLRADHQRLRSSYDQLSKDYGSVMVAHNQVKTDYNSLQLKASELQEDLVEARENVAAADMEFKKLESKMETVCQISERIESDNQALFIQIKQLLNQNQELLTQAFHNKDHFAEEEKAYLEKLADLHRQKEHLEEKIMEHYKNSLSQKKKGLCALIARKARGIISRGPRRGKSKNNLTEVNDNSSQGSGSTEPMSVGGLAGVKSSEDVNDSATSDKKVKTGQHCSVISLENYGEQRTMLLTRNKFMKMTDGSLLNRADSNNSDDSFPDEMKFYESIQCHRSSDTESHNKKHSVTGESCFHHHCQPRQHQQSLSKTTTQIWQDIPNVAASSLISSAETDLSITKISLSSSANENESSSHSSNGDLPCEVFKSISKCSNNKSADIIYCIPCCSSSKLEDDRLKCMQAVNTDGQLVAEEHLLENNRRNSSQLPPANVSTSQVGTFKNEQPTTSTKNLQSDVSALLKYPITLFQSYDLEKNQFSHLLYNTMDKKNGELLQTPTVPPLLVPTTEHFDHSVISFSSSEDLSTFHYAPSYTQLSVAPDKDSKNPCNSRNIEKESRNMTSASLKRRKLQITKKTSQSHLYQFKSTLSQSQPGMSSDNQSHNIDFSVVSGHATHRPRAHIISTQNNAYRCARPAGTMSHSSEIKETHSRPPSENRSKRQIQCEPPGCGDKRDFPSRSSSRQIQAEKNLNNCNNQYSERPKSVPPYINRNYEYNSEDFKNSLPDFLLKGYKNVIDSVSGEASDGHYPRRSNIGLSRLHIQSNSKSDSQPLESQSSVQSLQQQLQQPHYCHMCPRDGSQTLLNRKVESDLRSIPCSQMQPGLQESQSFLCTSALQNSGGQPNSVYQFPTSRLDCIPLVQQNLISPAHVPQTNRQDESADMNKIITCHISSSVQSHSSVRNLFDNTSSSGLQHGERMLTTSYHISNSENEDCERTEYLLGSSLEYQIGMNKDSKHSIRRGGPKHIPFSPVSGNYSPSEQLCSRKMCYHPASAATLPQCSQQHGPSQNLKTDGPSRTDIICDEYREKNIGTYQLQQCIRSQGKSSKTHHNNTLSPEPTTGVSTSQNYADGLQSQSRTSQVSPQFDAPQTFTKQEGDVKEELAPNINLVWYEYGCV